MRSRTIARIVGLVGLVAALIIIFHVATRNARVRTKPERWIEALEPKVAETPELVSRGKELYERVCFHCHGTEGKGDGKVATFMVTKPRDFTTGRFKVRTTPTGYLPIDEDLFRTITMGFPEYGMPAFYFLSREDRWGLAYYLKQFDPRFQDEEFIGEATPIGRGPTKRQELVSRGKENYLEAGCAKCHGEEGRGDGPSAPTLKDEWGNRSYSLDFTQGAKMFKGGGRAQDIYRTLLTGMTGTPMPSYEEAFKEDAEGLWAIAYYVEEVATQGEAERRSAWEEFYRQQESSFSLQDAAVDAPEENWDGELSGKFERASAKAVAEKACLACHEGIEDINEKMKDYLFALGAGHEGRLCVVCHEGNPDAVTKKDAHAGMFPNPGSLWVVSTGKGCGKCHSNRNAL
ncbi:MAG: c-type cytochrome, partial [Candidatus Binatia bacterium]